MTFFNLPVSFWRPLRCNLAIFSAFLTDGLVAKSTPLKLLPFEGTRTFLTSNLVQSSFAFFRWFAFNRLSFLCRFPWSPSDEVVANITNDRTNTSSTLPDEKCTAIFMFSRAISTPCSNVHFCIGKLQTKALGMWFYGLHSFQPEIWPRNIIQWVTNIIGVKALLIHRLGFKNSYLLLQRDQQVLSGVRADESNTFRLKIFPSGTEMLRNDDCLIQLPWNKVLR